MTIFMVEKYTIKPDKLGEFNTVYKKFEAFLKKRKALFKEVKSHKMFSRLIGGHWGEYVEMTEVENFADFEKLMSRVMQDKEYLTKIYPEMMALIVPGTHSLEVWNSFP